MVLGAGPVGQNAAVRARAGGLSVAMVERELVGGECSYWACVPSKALLRPVIAVADADHVDGARDAVSGSISAAGVFGRRDRYVSNWDDAGQADWVAGIGATLVRGHGRLDGPRRVAITSGDVEVSVLIARHAVVVCIGSRAALPGLPGMRPPSFTEQLKNVVGPVVNAWFRADVQSLDNIPQAGGALVASNHTGGMLTPDVLIFASAHASTGN